MASVSDVTRFICLFHDSGRANAAINALEGLGLTADRVSTASNSGGNEADGVDSLAALKVPDRDVKRFQDGLRHGGVVITLEASESLSDDIEQIFRRYSAGKIDETELETVPEQQGSTAHREGLQVVGESLIPVVEEALRVGKRDVDRGGVRVTRQIVEEPAQQEVDLHAERVVMERREVNRPVTDADLNAGTRAIEFIETAEVPVVQKVARVVEEVRVGKVASDRNEVVQDTVRHTEVKVEKTDPSVA